jgi:hypothetical protein
MAPPTPSAPTALHVYCDTFLFEFIHDCLTVGLSVISKLQVKIAHTSLAEYVVPVRDLLNSNWIAFEYSFQVLWRLP